MIDTTLRNTVEHDPPNSYGNCHSVCFAAIMGLDVDDVPHFFAKGDTLAPGEAEDSIQSFLDARGWRQSAFRFPVADWQDVATTLKFLSPGVPAILGGKSSRGCGHSVVILDGEIILDPTGSGIVAPFDEDESYWVTILMPCPPHWGDDDSGSATP